MNLTTIPQISVVMPVYNALPFLNWSISSILGQTFSDFEFVILDDASTDGSSELLRDWSRRDARIQLYESDEQLGLARSSNAVVAKARAPIIARMDADDIAHPDRLKRQLAILTNEPEVVVVGTLCNGIDAAGNVVRPRDRWRLLRPSNLIPFPHGSAMFRREVFDQVGGYDDLMDTAEDQDLFRKMAKRGRVLTIADVLYSYRYHSSNATLLNGSRAVNGTEAEPSLAAFYMMGAMRLWAGEPPTVLGPMLKKKSLKWTPKTLMFLASAFWGHISPATLKACLRLSIRARDFLASVRVRDGKFYDWKYE
jgi:glycosyltransferase involved in cell wall biosynthesis